MVATKLIRSRASRALVFSWSTVAGILITTKGHPPIGDLVLAPTGIFVIALSVYLLNDIVDSDIDRINAPTRPIPSQAASLKGTFVFLLFLSVIGMSIAYLLGPLAFVIGIMEIVLGVCYSMRPMCFKDRFLVKTFAIGAGGVLANFFGGASVGIFNLNLVYCAAMFVIFLFATSPINDLADYAGDKALNRRTIPIIIGPTRTVELSIFASVTPFISAVVLSRFLGINALSIFLLSVLAARSLQLLLPLVKQTSDLTIVRKRHKQMVPLHFVLLAAIVIGTIAL